MKNSFLVGTHCGGGGGGGGVGGAPFFKAIAHCIITSNLEPAVDEGKVADGLSNNKEICSVMWSFRRN